MRAPRHRSLPLALCGVAALTLAAAPAAASGSWHVSVNGQPLSVPSPVVSGRLVLPVGALARALGDVVVGVGAGSISLSARSGPPQPYLTAPAGVLLAAADLGPGYTRATPAPAKTPALSPADAQTQLGEASVIYTMLPAKDLKHLPVSVYYGPAEIALTAAEYAGADRAATALADTAASLSAHGGAWPGVPGPYTPVTALPAPVGDADFVWSADSGKIWLIAARVDNWVFTSAAGGTTLDMAWTLWQEQVHRIEAVKRPMAPPVAPVGSAANLPTSDEGPLAVSLDGVPLGTATWTALGYALPASAAARALGLQPERTGASSLNLQGASLVDNGNGPAVIAAPRTLILSPTATWGVPFRPLTGVSASNSALEQATPSIIYQLSDWGRMGAYSIQFDTTPRAAAATGAPKDLLVGLVEFSTSAGAYQAVLTESRALGRIQPGARPLALGDLNGQGGVGTVTAVTAKVFGKKVTSRDDWFVYQVDNWEVVVGAADPDGYFTPRTLWPYLAQLAQYVQLDGRPAP